MEDGGWEGDVVAAQKRIVAAAVDEADELAQLVDRGLPGAAGRLGAPVDGDHPDPQFAVGLQRHGTAPFPMPPTTLRPPSAQATLRSVSLFQPMGSLGRRSTCARRATLRPG